ncbi:MAG: hypothetical protein HXY25_11650, partial [Alphaproteobacteria bacterium]|nr:hypothetical protein [Alphaproteobacteria bacterium]
AGKLKEAQHLAAEAHALEPGFVPGSIELAEALAGLGRAGRAGEVVLESWARAPHPRLAALYAGLRPGEPIDRRIDRFAALFEANPAHPESRLHFAELALAGGRLLAARDALRPLLEPLHSADVGVLMAEIEEADGEPAAAERWLRAAAEAPRDPLWTCTSCLRGSDGWSAQCPHCGAFDQLAWREPPAGGHVRRRIIVDGAETDAEAAARAEEGGLFSRLFKPSAPARPVSPAPISSVPAVISRPAQPPARPSGEAGSEEGDGDGDGDGPVIFVPPRAPDDPGPQDDDPRRW